MRIFIAFEGSRKSFDIAADETVLAIKQMVKVIVTIIIIIILIVC